LKAHETFRTLHTDFFNQRNGIYMKKEMSLCYISIISSGKYWHYKSNWCIHL